MGPDNLHFELVSGVANAADLGAITRESPHSGNSGFSPHLHSSVLGMGLQISLLNMSSHWTDDH